MKPVSLVELQSVMPELESLVGARFQELQTTEHQIGLGFFSHGELIWWVFDLSSSAPMVARLDRWPLKSKSRVTPALLFGRAHFVNRILQSVTLRADLGRVLVFDFGGREIEIRLFPHGTNLILRGPESSLSLHKVEELKVAPTEAFASPAAVGPAGSETVGLSGGPSVIRDLQTLTSEWSARFQSKTASSESKDISKILEKKTKALLVLQDSLNNPEWKLWQSAGEWIQQNQSLQVPSEFTELVQADQSLADNMLRIFNKSKLLQGKLRGTEERLRLLQEEILDLQSGKAPKKPSSQKKKPTEDAARMRTVPLADKVELRIGKSGADNLLLLRKSQAWDYWIHLKDYPGAHGILSRPRNLEPSQKMLENAACWIGRESTKAKLIEGDRFEVLIAETRYVRPIKADKLGRVNYQNERVFRFVFHDPK